MIAIFSASSTLQLSQYRDGDSTEFFAHENHPWSSSLLVYGALLLPTKKPDLVEILTTDQPDPPSYYHAKVVYDAAIIIVKVISPLDPTIEG